MSSFIQWIIKLVGGWLPIGTKPFPEWLGKVLWAIGICVAVNLMIAWVSPNKSKTIIEQGGTQNIYNEQRDTMGIGCNAWRLYIKGGMKAR